MNKAPKKSLSKAKEQVTSRTKTLLQSAKKKFDAIDFPPLWQKVKKGFEQTAEAVGKGTEKAAERAVSAAKRASVEYKIVEHRREQQKLFADLGGRVYDLMKQSPQALSPKDPHIMATIDSLAMTAKKIAALEEEAGALKK
ncbi:MAG: hypothetical protein AABZ10_10905 [Nitrospirota bacterium]